MKRTILFVTLLSLLAVKASGQTVKAPERQGWNESEKGYLYGDIESIAIITYNVVDKFGEIVKGNITYENCYKFNPKGDVIEVWNGSTLVKFSYNSQDKVDKCDEYNSDGSLIGKTIYKYYSQGNEIEEAHYNADGSLIGKSFHKYDSQGKVIEWTNYDGQNYNLPSWKYSWEYDEQGKLTKRTEYSSSYLLRYDYKRKITYRNLMSDHNSDGSIREKWLYNYKYDQQGDVCVIEESKYKSNGSLDGRTICQYDSQHNKTEEAYYTNDGFLWKKYRYKYDSQGNVIEEKYYDSLGSLELKTVYKYDPQGNLVETIKYKGEIMQPIEMEVREIIYRK